MDPTIDYESFPARFIHCLNERCERGERCLRRQMALRIPKTYQSVVAVNPAHYESAAGDGCCLFLLDKPQRFARGFTGLFDNIPLKKALAIQSMMKHYLGRSTYYRCHRKERLIKPDEQKYIQKLFLGQNIKEEPRFDEYVEYYDFS